MSFQETSKDIRIIDNHILTAKCRDSSLELDLFIGKDDGYFTWGAQNFSQSAQDITIDGEGHIAGRLKPREGSWTDVLRFNLGDRIQNMNGNLAGFSCKGSWHTEVSKASVLS
ncbi:MAG: Cyanovirin-N [Benniella sp.]|nr:MAG: Cyanovirin-N [Benniella sp.]